MTQLAKCTYLFFIVFCTQVYADATTSSALVDEGNALIKQLGSGLKGALQSAMKAGGPTQAVAACNLQAPDITGALNTNDWTISRTSLKTRNSSNQPTDWEADVLERMQAQAESGTPLSEIRYQEIVSVDGQETFRYMKAIPTEQVCLKCHGSKDSMSAELKNKIEALYPEDEATGFKVGDLRGAFSLSKRL